MIDFRKSVKKSLFYDRQQYIEFLNDDFTPSVKWYGVSFQLPGVFEGKDIGLDRFVEVYECWFKNIVISLDNGSHWIVNHDRKGLNWLPNDEDNLTSLRALFKERNIPNTFKGALVFTMDDLLAFTKDLISYPYAVFNEDGLLYADLDISHTELPFIIKISGHLCIDFLSTDQKLLREVATKNLSSQFIIKEYRGTLLG